MGRRYRMAFTCVNEARIEGGSEEERRRAATLVLAADSADEDSASRKEDESSLTLRFESVDGLPEAELTSLAEQFPGLSFTMIYFSLDGEFFGYSRSGAGGEGAESEDFDEDTREAAGKRYDGDGIAFVRARYGLRRAGE
jgi:hypothetical protein